VTKVKSQLSVSLDGFVAGPYQSREHPLGKGGERLHEWFMGEGPRHEVDEAMGRGILEGNGAYVMGRNMFGPIRGGWGDGSWRGWWGEEPPYHAPVFVLTHHAREPLVMQGGTTFHFVTDGIEAALERARAAAGELDVDIAGGASTVNQYLAAGLVDELHLHVAPVLLHEGERLFAAVGDMRLEPLEAVASPAATHVRYRILR
jgi:dihydrofolate reductase